MANQNLISLEQDDRIEAAARRLQMGAALAVFMHQAGIGEFRPAEVVNRRQRTEGQEMHDGRQEVVRVDRKSVV